MAGVEPAELMIFGVRGDLARRKLLPALYALESRQMLHPLTRIIGIARAHWDQRQFRAFVLECLEHQDKMVDQALLEHFANRLHYVRLDLTDAKGYRALQEVLHNKQGRVLHYFATPPGLFPIICENMNAYNLVTQQTRVILEKPIGHDLDSSRVINDKVAGIYSEANTFRIDHYLGKETVQNLVALRFANLFFSNQWGNQFIDHIQITVAERLGISGRWGYYDQAGQVRDMLQNHLLQLVAMIAMEPPPSLDSASVRSEKYKVLQCLRPITRRNIHKRAIRGQYTGGYLAGEAVPGYLEEPGANTTSMTETFVALRIDIDNWRWAGVPFYVRTGKRLPHKRTEIIIQFKGLAHNLFQQEVNLVPNKLVIRLEPDEGIQLVTMSKVPGLDEGFKLQPTRLDLTFSRAFRHHQGAGAYERLLYEALRGNQALFVHRSEVEAAWAWVDGLCAAWAEVGDRPKPYPAGSWGPVSSIALIAQDGRQWEE